MPERQLALLRSINVGGRHLVPMAALRDSFAALGCTGVETYIQSGNVVFSPPDSGLSAAALAAALERSFGFPVPVILRTAGELRLTIAANPFAAGGAEIKALHAVFLERAPSIASLPLLEAAVAPGEQFALGERVLYLHLPAGAGRSKLVFVPGKAKFGTAGTMRNWATTLKLAKMLEA